MQGCEWYPVILNDAHTLPWRNLVTRYLVPTVVLALFAAACSTTDTSEVKVSSGDTTIAQEDTAQKDAGGSTPVGTNKAPTVHIDSPLDGAARRRALRV